MQIRVTVPVLEHGSVQWVYGQQADVPEQLARQLQQLGKVEIMPRPETATMPRPEDATMPRAAGKPKPPSVKKRS